MIDIKSGQILKKIDINFVAKFSLFNHSLLAYFSKSECKINLYDIECNKMHQEIDCEIENGQNRNLVMYTGEFSNVILFLDHKSDDLFIIDILSD